MPTGAVKWSDEEKGFGDEADSPRGLPAEISNSLAAVWKRYAGRRPATVETAVSGTRIACVIRDSVRAFDEGIAASGGPDEDGTPLPTLAVSTYKHEAINAVAKVTHRKVMAFVSNHDAETDVAKEVFILDYPPPRRGRVFVDHRAAERRPRMGGE